MSRIEAVLLGVILIGATLAALLAWHAAGVWGLVAFGVFLSFFTSLFLITMQP